MITNLIQVEELDGHIYVSVDELHKREDEIERLNKSLEEQRHFYLEKLQQKENKIKEVRDKAIQKIANNSLDFMYRQAYKDILEMLDKGE